MARPTSQLSRQKTNPYSVLFRNFGSITMPAYGVGLITAFTQNSDGSIQASVTDISGGNVVGYLVNGPTAVAANGRGSGCVGVGPVPALYNTGDGTPEAGQPWGIKYNTADYKLYKGYGGFTVASDVTGGGSSSTARVMVVPEFRIPQRIVGHLRATSLQITNADTGTRIIVLNQKGVGSNGTWPSATTPLVIEADNGTGQMTVRRSGCWLVSASWTSEAAARFAAPFQSKVNRAHIGVYNNGTLVTGAFADYYHHSIANADSSPTAGVAIPVPASITPFPLYLATADVIDLRVAVSEVVADSGTATEGYINFRHISFTAEYVGPQLWRNDY